MTTWTFYREACKAEDYTVLAGRLSGVLPDLRRLYNNGAAGELLLDDGEKSGIYIKLVLVADKPFIRHVCGLLNHNSDAFGAPFCKCKDEEHKPALYDFTMDKHNHYGQIDFLELCHNAHVADWEALGQREPEHWYFCCKLCKKEFGTEHGGRAKLDAIDSELNAMEPGPMASALKRFADKHAAQMLRRPPLLPFHFVVHDPMHAVHCEANVLIDESVHKHLMVESNDPEVKEAIATAQATINKMWKDANLPKFIQFGKDSKGAHSHALNGPCFEAVWGKPQLIIDTIKAMQPVYELLESRKLTPELKTEAIQQLDVGAAQASTEQSPGKKQKAGERAGAAPPKKGKKLKKDRRAAFSDDEDDVPSTPAQPSLAATERATPLTTSTTPAALTYSQRVGAAFVAFIQFYAYLKKDHEVPACKLDAAMREERADQAIELALTMQRAMLALIGTTRRRTYAHDLVYGTYKQYMLFAKPWNCATEGNEHAHQDMKKFFKELATHNPYSKHGDCFQVLRLTVIKQQFLRTKAHLLPASNYAAMRANSVLAQHSVRLQGKRRGADSGPKGLKMYGNKEQARLADSAERIRDEVCVPCAAE